MAISRPGVRSGSSKGRVAPRSRTSRELNEVFSAAFTDRYRRDGLSGVRVPFLNPPIWRYAIEDAAEGAMIWRDERGDVAAFNMVHQSGAEGWMGPLAVRSISRATASERTSSRGASTWLRDRDATIIGLETMPRTMDNIGFYSRLGFSPGQLTLTLTYDAVRHESSVELLSRLSPAARDEAIGECRALLDSVLPGSDYIARDRTDRRPRAGDTLLLRDRDRLVGFALAHTAPLVEGRTRDELRVLKLVLADERRFGVMRESHRESRPPDAGSAASSFRMQGEYSTAYRAGHRDGRARPVERPADVAGSDTCGATGRGWCSRIGRS